MGKNEGFSNIGKVQVHAVSTNAMTKFARNAHENVPGFDEALLKKMGQKIERARQGR